MSALSTPELIMALGALYMKIFVAILILRIPGMIAGRIRSRRLHALMRELSLELDPTQKYTLPKLKYQPLSLGIRGYYDYRTNCLGLVHQMSWDGLTQVLTHELRHWWQFQSGALKFIKVTPYKLGVKFQFKWKKYKGVRVQFTHQDYLNHPWEKDARRWAYREAHRLNLDSDYKRNRKSWRRRLGWGRLP